MDILALQGCVATGLWLRGLVAAWFPIGLSPSTFHGIHLAVLIIPASGLVWGLYPGYGMSPVERLRRRTLISLAGFGLMTLYDHLAQNSQWSRGVLMIAMALSLVALPLSHALARALLIRLRLWGEKVALLGEPASLTPIVEALRTDVELGWIPVLTFSWPPPIDLDWGTATKAILVAPRGGMSLTSVVDELPFRRVAVILDPGGGRSLGVSAHETGIGLGLEMRNNLLYPANMLMKRLMDLVLTLVLALPAAMTVAVFALLVKQTSPGPAFYYQWREGRNGRLFRLWKIRSMVNDAETRLPELLAQEGELRQQWKTHMKLHHDPRVIPWLGSFMRRFSIDELPQLYNVLIGEMSLVGPRPLPAYHLDEVPPRLAELRRQARPGITGWAQISGRSDRTVMQQVEFDAYYIRNWSFWIDTYVLTRTVAVVAKATGAF